MGRTGIHYPVKTQVLLAGHFNKAAISALTPALRGNGAGKPRRFIRPDNNLAPISRTHRISIDRHILADIGHTGVLFRAFALEVAADQRRTASADS